MSMAEGMLLRSLQARVEALEALVAADPVTERLQRLEMRVGSLQGQLTQLRARAAPAPLDAPGPLPDAPANSHGDAAA